MANVTEVRVVQSTKPNCPKCGIPMTSGMVGLRVRRLQCCTPTERFWAKVEKRGPDECWPWRGAVTSQHGYGNVAWEGHHLGAHKVAWIVTHGPVPAGLCVLHKCDNRICCNPAHYFLGTKKDNGEDMSAKVRGTHGEKAHNAKLTAAKVLEIRSLYKKTGPRMSNAKALSAQFGVTSGTINEIANGRRWTHIK